MCIERLLSSQETIEESDLKAVLRDHFDAPTSVCHHENPQEDEPAHTKASVIMDLDERRMLAAAGPPCENEYVAIPVAT
jgi:isopenicillin-N N-acyltransferase-like protein